MSSRGQQLVHPGGAVQHSNYSVLLLGVCKHDFNIVSWRPEHACQHGLTRSSCQSLFLFISGEVMLLVRTAVLGGGALRCRPVGCRSAASYVQGQSPDPRIREYFYYVDHQGQVSYC